jgi:hypothetical protein
VTADGHPTLFEDRYLPLTATVGFLEAALDDFAEALTAWRRSHGSDGSVAATPATGDLERLLQSLEPLVQGPYDTELLVETDSAWTARFDNCANGGDQFGPVSYLAKELTTRGLLATSAPQIGAGQSVGMWGAVQFHLFGPIPNPILNYVRTIDAVNDGGQWTWNLGGEAQPFEQPDRYLAPRVRDRFTPEMLDSYCQALGIRLFDPGFYGPRAWLIKQDRDWSHKLQRLTLQEVRRRQRLAAD